MSFIRNIFEAVNNNLISGGAYYLIAKSVIVTIILVLVAWIVTAILGSLLSYFMSYHKRGISGLAHAISFIFRSTPVVLLLLLFYYVIFKRLHLSVTLISGIAIGLYGAGHFAEIIARQVREAKKHQDITVIRRLKQVYFSVTLPQTIEDTLFMVKRLSILLLQWTTIVGYIAVNDLTEIMTKIGQRTMYPFFSIFVCIIFYLVMTILIEGIFHAIQKKLMGEDEVEEEEEVERIKRSSSIGKEQDRVLSMPDEIPDVDDDLEYSIEETNDERSLRLEEEDFGESLGEDSGESGEGSEEPGEDEQEYLLFTKDLAKQVEEEFAEEMVQKEDFPTLEGEMEEFNREDIEDEEK